MSVIVAIRDTDRIWLATDSQVTSGTTKGSITSTNSFKVFKNAQDVLIGGVGTMRDLNIISTSETPFISEASLLKNEISFTEIVRRTVPLLYEELRQFKRLYISHGIEYFQNTFLFAFKETCFTVDGDGCVTELDDMFAIGSGAEVAESAYTILRDVELSCEEKAIKAIISSCERDLFVNFPILITDTFTNQFKLFDGEDYYLINDKTGEIVLIEEPTEVLEEKSSEEETVEKELPIDTDELKIEVCEQISMTCQSCSCGQENK